MTKEYISPLIEKLLSEVSPEQFEATSKQMESQGPKAEAQDLVLSFYYRLPNNGSLKTGINSCESRYKEAVVCAMVTVNKIISIAPWGGDIDGEIEEGSKEYYQQVKTRTRKTMTPKEKANELVVKFTIVGLQQRNEGIQCAIIMVDELLSNSTFLLSNGELYYWSQRSKHLKKKK
jgi:hypothetical protein